MSTCLLQTNQAPCVISLGEITKAVVESGSSVVSQNIERDDWKNKEQKVKNLCMDFRVLLLAPPPPSHSLFPASPLSPPLPNQFCAGALLTQVKGLWFSSRCLSLCSRWSGGVGSINAAVLQGSVGLFVSIRSHSMHAVVGRCVDTCIMKVNMHILGIFIKAEEAGLNLRVLRGRHWFSGTVEPLVWLHWWEDGSVAWLRSYDGWGQQRETGQGVKW